MQEDDVKPRAVSPVKLSFQTVGEIRSFCDKKTSRHLYSQNQHSKSFQGYSRKRQQSQQFKNLIHWIGLAVNKREKKGNPQYENNLMTAINQ